MIVEEIELLNDFEQYIVIISYLFEVITFNINNVNTVFSLCRRVRRKKTDIIFCLVN